MVGCNGQQLDTVTPQPRYRLGTGVALYPSPTVPVHRARYSHGHHHTSDAKTSLSVDARPVQRASPSVDTLDPTGSRPTPTNHDRWVMRVWFWVRVVKFFDPGFWCCSLHIPVLFYFLDFFGWFCDLRHSGVQFFLLDRYMKSRRVREGAKRPTAPDYFDFG